MLINLKMLRGFICTGILFLFSGRVCMAGPLQYENYYGQSQMSGSMGAVQEELASVLAERCGNNPLIETKIRVAIADLSTCIMSAVEELKYSGGFSGIQFAVSPSERMRRTMKLVCTLYVRIRPCILTMVNQLKTCMTDLSVEDLMSAYDEAVSIACVDDGEKMFAAVMELTEEKEECMTEIASKLQDCKSGMYDLHTNQSLVPCRRLDCAKRAVNVCGGPKRKMNTLLDELMAVTKRYLRCSYARSAATTLAFSTSPLSAATLAIAFLAWRLMSRESLSWKV